MSGDGEPAVWRGRAFGLIAILCGALLSGLTLSAPEVQPWVPGRSSGGLAALWDIAIASAAFVVIAGVGANVLARFRSRRPEIVDVAASVIVGCATIALTVTALGLASYLTRAILGGLWLVFGVMAGTSRELDRIAFGARDWWRSRTAGARRALVIGVVFAAGLAVIAVSPVWEWDTLMYHATVPAEVLEAGAITPAADNLHLALTGASHAIDVLLLAAGCQAGLMLLNLLMLIVLALTVGWMGATLGPPAAEPLSVVLLLAWTGLTMAVGSGLVEPALVAGVTVTMAFVVRLAESADARLLPVIGLLAGSAMGFKYQAAPFLIGVAVTALVVSWRALGSSAWRPLSGAVVLALLAWVPVVARNALLFENPFYFLLGERQTDPWLVALGAAARAIETPLTELRDPFSFTAWLTDPASITIEAGGATSGLHPTVALLGAIGLIVAWRRAWIVALPIVAHLGGVLLVASHLNTRYLYPVAGALTVLAGIGGAVLWARDWQPLKLAVLAAVLVAIVPTGRGMFDRLIVSGDLSHVVGVTPTTSWATKTGNEEFGRLIEVDSWVRGQSPERVVGLFEARGGGFSFELLQDNLLVTWPTLVEILGGECLPRGAASHILVNEAALDYYLQRGLEPDDVRWGAFAPFAERCLDEVGSRAGYTLYATR